MDIQLIKEIIFPGVHNIISKLEEDQHEIKLTLLREIFNEAINCHLNISHTSNASIKAMFSGRGRAWAKTKVSEDNIVWLNILNTLNEEILSSDTNSENFMECSNLLDTFNSTGIAWMRFGSASKDKVRFHLRTKGSKLDHHVKIYIDQSDLLNGNIANLEGVPHKLGLESGDFKEHKAKKEFIDIEVQPEELRSFGIQKIEDLI
jgi:hypothetical protein